jgi:hypothetical protein
VAAPGHNRLVPLEPEFIVPQDGHDTQDCESRAVRRWLSAHGHRYTRLRPVYFRDDVIQPSSVRPQKTKARRFPAGLVPVL